MTDNKELIAMGQEFRDQPDQYSELITELADALEDAVRCCEACERAKGLGFTPTSVLPGRDK